MLPSVLFPTTYLPIKYQVNTYYADFTISTIDATFIPKEKNIKKKITMQSTSMTDTDSAYSSAKAC